MENNMPAPTIAEVARDYVSDGVPSSGAHEIKKSDLRAWGGWVQSLVTSGVLSSGPWFATKESMTLGYAANTIAVVYDDTTASENGLYIKAGASGSGSWTQLTTFLPGYQFVTASPTGASTANAIVATTSPRLPAGDGVALVSLTVLHENTESPVTVEFDGGDPVTIVSMRGDPIRPKDLKPGMMLTGYVAGSQFRVSNDFDRSFLAATNTGAGSANAIQATTPYPLPNEDGATLVTLPIVADNTSSPVTVSFNGASALTIKSSNGSDIEAGGFIAGMTVTGYKSGSAFRLISDQIAAAIIAQAQEYALQAQAAAGSVTAAVNYLGEGALGPNLRIRPPSNDAGRVYVQPKGLLQSGTATKLDMFGTDYEADTGNYWIQSLFTTVGDPESRGVAMRANWNMKAVGDWFGGPLEQAFGFSDFNVSGVPMKIYQVDFADTFRAPHKGAWRSGMTIAINDHVTHQTAVVGDFATYKATTAGTTGATAPTHSTGTASDGGVTWEWVFTHNSFNIRPVVVFGERDDMPVLGVTWQNDRVQFHKNTLTKNTVAHRFLNATADAVVGLITALSSNRFRIATGDSGAGMDFDLAGKWARRFGGYATSATTDTSGSASIDLTGKSDIVLNPGGALNITAFTGYIGRQEFYIESVRSDTVITAGTGIYLNGQASLTLRQGTPYLFKANTGATQVKLVASTGA